MSDHHDVDPTEGLISSPAARFMWQSGGLIVGRGAAFVALVLVARELGLARYGSFVVLLAMLEAASIPWKPTVQQGAAAALGAGASHRSWRRTLALWWLAGSVVLGPIAWFLESGSTAVALVVASAANALMIEYVPARILVGEQRQIAVGTSVSQLVRLAFIMALIVASMLTPATAFLAYIAGYLVGAALLKTRVATSEGPMGALQAEVGVEALRWVEAHGPILVVALVLGLDTAGGFDLLFKLATALTEVIAGVGIVLLPDLVSRERPLGQVVARGLRIPTLVAAVAAVVFAIAAGPLLRALTSATLDLGLSPAVLAVLLALAPWMGVSKAALIAAGGSSWILPSQLATASATLVAAVVGTFGLVWAAGAVATATVAAATIRWIGMRSVAALPELSDITSLAMVRQDFDSLRRSPRGAR